MATYTDNYNLTKPTMNELADIRVINGNMDTVDTVMHGAQVSIADAYDPTLTYDVGDLVMNDFLLYKCVTAVTVPEAFDPTKWERTTAAEGSGGGGGSSVIANPVGTPTDDLDTVEIDGVIYNIVGGGGGNYTADVLFENTDFTVPSGSSNVINTYTLENSIDDYDAVLVEAFLYVTPSIKANSQTMLIPSDDCYSQNTDKEWDFLMFADNFSGNNQGRRRIGFGFPSSTSIKVVGQRITENECPILYKVIGFKFGGGGINYSTTEQVIGTWIDGSIIYERTYDNLSVQTNGTNWVTVSAIDVTNIDQIINAKALRIQTASGKLINMPLGECAVLDGALKISMISATFDDTIRIMVLQYTKTTSS
jgi:hypothetical protein